MKKIEKFVIWKVSVIVVYLYNSLEMAAKIDGGSEYDDKADKALKAGALGSEKRFEQTDWKQAEQAVSPFNQSVFDCLKEFAAGRVYVEAKKQVVLGEELYCRIRPLLEAFEWGKLVEVRKKEDVKVGDEPKKGKGKKSSGGKSMQQIRLDATNARMAKQVPELLATFKRGEMNDAYGMEQKYTELIGVTFMYCVWFVLCAQPERYARKAKNDIVYELIVGIKKFIGKASKYQGKSVLDESKLDGVSATMILDLGVWLERLLVRFPYDGLVVYDIAPRLLIHTKYDGVIPSCGITPRQNQVDLVKAIRENIVSGFCLAYNAMMASGKTTTAGVCIPTIIDDLNKSAKAKGYLRKNELLYVCNQPAVKNQVASTAYNSKIKFAVAYAQVGSGHIRVINHNSTSDADRSLIICSPDVAASMLQQEALRVKNEGGYNRYWLFLDEPTIGAAYYGSEALIDNMKLMMVMPSHTILASATLPSLKKMIFLTENYKRRFPLGFLGTIYSSSIEIGCDIKTFANERVMPHLGCVSRESLRCVIGTIMSNPFLGRLYTSQVTKFIWEKLREAGIEGLPDIRAIFADVANLSLDKVREVCMDMLKLLAESSDELVSKICATTILDVASDGDDEEEKSDELPTFGDDEDETEVSEDVSFDKLGTTQAYRYPRMNLVVDTDPLEFAERHFKGLLEYAAKLGCDSSRKLYATYKGEMEEQIKKSQKLEKRVKNETKRSKQQQEMADEEQPTILFPKCCQINVEAHLKEFAKSHLAKVNVKEIRPIYPLELIPFDDCHVPDWVMLLLWAGVGIYSPTSKSLNSTYQKTVLGMAVSGSLAYFISDVSIAYGINFPFYRIFITGKFSDSCQSLNTLLQLFARAGRVGESYKAEIYLDSSAAAMLLKYVNNPDSANVNIEAENMKRTYKDLELSKMAEEEYEKKRLPDERKVGVELEERERLHQIDLMFGSQIKKGMKGNIIPLSQVSRKDAAETDDDDLGFERGVVHGWRRDKVEGARVAPAPVAVVPAAPPAPAAPAAPPAPAPPPPSTIGRIGRAGNTNNARPAAPIGQGGPVAGRGSRGPIPRSTYLPPHMRNKG
ncbi:MAG: DEAD-like helicases family protein [Hyperionvirus sp.]|uniref:DEAD-like helicases family protein n=1 Tax=Hyperionvirus sp. TaxID=2487770 RepID=A0A3G5AC09_9VIRU|nr:MAG: DEAD-like helicases family protein [Hyperionvirus sp.]